MTSHRGASSWFRHRRSVHNIQGMEPVTPGKSGQTMAVETEGTMRGSRLADSPYTFPLLEGDNSTYSPRPYSYTD